MKIIVALNNSIIKDKLKEKYKEIVYNHDFTYMEDLIEFLLKQKNNDIVLITKDTLNGNLTDKLYIKNIREINKTCKIIYIVKNLDVEYKKFLLSNEIFNIIVGDVFDFNVIVDNIESKDKIIYKSYNNRYSINENETSYFLENKKCIAVYGINGAGKTYISSYLSKKIAQEINCKTLYFNLDNINSSIQYLNDIYGENDVLNYLIKNVDDLNEENIENYIVFDKYIDNLNYITNDSLVISEKQEEKILKIIDILKNNYNFIFLDLYSKLKSNFTKNLLIKSDVILFVINPNYLNINKSIKYLEFIQKEYNINKDKINIVVNKCGEMSLDRVQLKSIFNDYKIIMYVKNNNSIEGYINGFLSKIQDNTNLDLFYDSLNLKQKSKKYVLNKLNFLRR